ncbi:tape measure protein [Parabacteroides merdae]|uniref:tape measure protein n=1 Tax=Parabacteroides merdae TaxID=46503 RepID=UPI001C220FC0|nr:tape measure protein [Parabacteroides merdae]MBU9060693.1 tape measure protein [Parabacteroides merdae]MCG4836442.1 tape measure protein [Parabacteroides merdae]MCQ5194714.1 tape measure protein [Parabacteroides merdae]
MPKLAFHIEADYQKVIKLREEIDKLKSTISGMDGNTSPATFRAMEAQLAKNTKELDSLVVSAVRAGNEINQGFKKKIFDASQVVNGFSEKIIAQKSVIKGIEADVKRLGEAYRIALKRNPLSANKKLEEYNAVRKALDEEKAVLFDLTQQQAGARLSVKKLRDEYALYKDDAKEVVESNNGIAISWKKVLAVIGGVGVLKALGSEIIRVRGEFQAADTAIQTLLGSKEKADALMSQVREYAKISPLEFSDVTQATQMMLGFNIEVEKVPRYLQAIGDVSMGDTQRFNSLTLAFSQMSAAGKLMGQDLNQMINAGFNPLQIMSDKTGKSIAALKEEMSNGAISAEMVQQAFIDATSAGGKFYQMSENASRTINGQLSMMQDAMDGVFNELGQKSEDVIIKGIQTTTSLINNYETIGKVLVGLIATYGTYRTAVMLVTAAESKHTIVEIGLTNARILARKAQLALNAAMITNPYVALATVVAGLSATMLAMSTSITSAEKAQKRFNEEQDKMIQREEERKNKVESLIRVMQDEAETELAKISAYEQLQKLSPAITGAYKREELAVLDLAEANKLLNKERDTNTYDSYIRNIDESISRLKRLREENGRLIGVSPSTGVPLTVNNNKAIAEEEAYLKRQQKALDDFKRKLSETKTETTKEETRNKSYWEKLKKDAKVARDALDISKKNSKEWNEYTKQIQEAQDQIDKYSSSNKKDKNAENQIKQQKKLANELLSFRRQNQQSEIDLMKEGSDKKIAQIYLDYDNEIAAILAKEKEWKDAQGGKLSKEQTVEIRTALVNSYVKREQSTSNVNKEQLEEEKRAMNEYLKEYGSYLEKRQAITELYNEKIAKATTEGGRLSLAEGMKKELADVDNEAQKSTSIITRLFDDMSKKNITSIRAIADEAEKFLSFLERGEYSSDNSFGITKEQFDVLRKSPDQLKAIKDEIANVRREADQMETSFNKVSNGLKKVFTSESDAKKLKEGLAEIEEGMNEIMQAGQFLSDTFSKLGDSFGGVFGGIAEGFSVAMDTVSSAMNGAKAGSMFGPIGASAGAAIGVVTSLAGAIAKIHDKKNEKRIQRLQDQIDTLDKSYEKLDKSIQKAYSNDASRLIDQQNKLLEQQKVLIQQQIREEQDKKNTDKDRIKEWQSQIDEINEAIADNKEKAVDAIFGEDLKSAIDNFANAQAEAWASGEDRAESAKDTVKKMMRQMVTESIKAATESSGAMEKIRDKLKEFYADNVLSGWEQDYIYNMAEELQKEIDRQFGWADSLMKDKVEEPEKEEDISENTLKGAYAKASQESIDLLAGQTGAVRILLEDIRGGMQPIREQMRLIYDMQSRGWEDVKAIRELSDKVEKNTDRIAENTREIKEVAGKISENTRGTVDALEGTINVKVKM